MEERWRIDGGEMEERSRDGKNTGHINGGILAKTLDLINGDLTQNDEN